MLFRSGVEYEVGGASDLLSSHFIFQPSSSEPVAAWSNRNDLSSPSVGSSDSSPYTTDLLTSVNPSGIRTVYEEMRPFPKRKFLSARERGSHEELSAHPRSGREADEGSGLDQKPLVKPVMVEVTRLPKHVLNKNLHQAEVKEEATCVQDSSEDPQAVPIRRRELASPSSDTSSESVSLLGKLVHSVSQSRPSEESRLSSPAHPVVSRTPRRFGDGKTPVARRSLPFSKSPKVSTSAAKPLPTSSGESKLVPAHWSPDEDFEVDPAPCLITSPSLDKERDGRKEGSVSNEALGAKGDRGGGEKAREVSAEGEGGGEGDEKRGGQTESAGRGGGGGGGVTCMY